MQGLDFLIQLYYFRAVKTAYLILQDRYAAEDIVQNAFLHAYEKINQLNSDRFGPWFLRSVVNASLKAARRQNTQLSLSAEVDRDGQSLEDLLADQRPTPKSQVEMDELAQQVRRALRRLPAEQRAALVLKYYLELSEVEMVAQLANQAVIHHQVAAVYRPAAAERPAPAVFLSCPIQATPLNRP